MFERVFIPLRWSRGHSAVHPAAAVRHRWRLARVPAPRSGSASRAEVHGYFPLIVETLARLRSRSCIIDGEAVACDDNGMASFDLIRHHRHNDRVFRLRFRPDRVERRRPAAARRHASASPRGWGSTEIRGSTPCKAEPRRGQWFLARTFIARTNAETSRRRAMASAV